MVLAVHFSIEAPPVITDDTKELAVERGEVEDPGTLDNPSGNASFVAALYAMRNAEQLVTLYRDTVLPKAEQALGSSRQAYAAGQIAFVELIERKNFKAVIADEVQRIRTPGSKRSRAMRQIAGAIPYRMGLSGTPLTNTVQDVLPLGSFLVPGEWKPRANENPVRAIFALEITSDLVKLRKPITGIKGYEELHSD